jgi:hypothetical protein
MLFSLLNHLRARVVKDDESEVNWLDLLEGEEVPNPSMIINGKT